MSDTQPTIDTNYTSETVCPYCGHETQDSWELSGDDGVDECGECEKPFRWARHVGVTYCTRKVEDA